MALLGRRRIWRRAARRAFTGAALVSFLVANIGMPLPAITRKDPSQPFPCQNHPCGCRSAEECWRHCCCFTPAERWVWARENDVEPPSYAEQPASEDSGRSQCCAHHEQEIAAAKPTPPACCSTASHDSSCCKAQAHSKSEKGKCPAGPRWILAVVSQQCPGATAQWLVTGTAVPPPPVVAWSPAWPLVGTLSYADLSHSSPAPNPPDPPPRSAS